ncbi:hypothetical protein L6164_004181 [Bauhinia variegata]|uniref:Uncharacterized protein n=1 Tax=Bauhinia variegata TaxID=167791 RepID=A0ACB9Q3M8_BAUVA|nr:hypothetical protein L6164_004181 [Bauhinia variegata]
MGVSFKVSKTGTRFHPKHLLQSEASGDEVSGNSNATFRVASKNEYSTRESLSDHVEAIENIAGVPNSSISSGPLSLAENEASFTLNLFPDGYSIGKPSENETAKQYTFQDVPKLLHPYDRTSESLFSAIESGHLPGDVLDDIPCKYVDGALTCEVHDYRRCSSEKGHGVSSTDGSPTVIRVRLKMSLENVVKDIPLISDNSWTYGDLMEVESRILKALQPQLHLDPTPKLDQLSDSPVPTKLNLSLSSLRRKRLRQMPEFTITSSNKIHGKKVCIDRVLESSTSGLADSGTISTNPIAQHTQDNLATQNLSANIAMALRPKSFVSDASIPGLPTMSHHSRYQMGVGTPRSSQEHGSVSAINVSGAPPAAQDIMISYADNANASASIHGRRENQDGQGSPLYNFAKRVRPAPAGLDAMQQRQISSRVDGLQGSDLNWQNTLLQQQAMSRGIQYPNAGIQKFSQQALERGLNQDSGVAQFAAAQQGMRITPKEEQFELEKLDGSEISRNKSEVQVEMETNHLDPQQSRLQQRLPQHPFMRSNFPQATWNNLGQHMEKEARKEDQIQKRKSVQSPRLSSGTLPQSPLSSKSGEFSNGSVGPNFGSVSAAAALGASQKEKTSFSSVPAAIGASSLTSSANDSIQRQHQAQLAVKRRSNSLPKTPAMSGVGSPVSVSNVSVPLNVSSPSVGTPALADQTLVERFSKIEMVTMRHQLNCKKNKVDDYPIRKQNYSPQLLANYLSNTSNGEDLKDDASSRSLSKSLVGGSMNVCKIRVLNFVLPERVVQGNAVSFIPKVRTRMIMFEKPSDGTVAMHYGDIDDVDFLASEDYLPTLPNTHFADLLAAEFCSQMVRDGYMMEEHPIQPRPNRVNLPSGSQASGAGVAPNTPAVEMQQYGEPIPSQSPNDAAKPTSSGNASLNSSSQNLVSNTRMLPPGNPQALQMSQGLISSVSMASRPLQLDPQQSAQQQQQQQQRQQLQQNQHSLMQQQNPQSQRSMMLGTNQLSHLNAIGQSSNIQLGNHMVNKPSPLHIQLLQQQQQQQQPQMPRKMMMGLGTAVGMSNMRSNMVGLGGLGSPINMGTARGMGGTGISAPMASISGVGNMGQIPMSLSQVSNISNAISHQFRSGSMTAAQAELLKLRMAQNRASMLGASQSGIAGISGARQVHPSTPSLSMLGQSLNRANIMQRAIGPMGPPKLMAGMSLMNQQQQQQQQFQQQIQQQQETTSPLQAVVSAPQVGSPSTMGVPPLNQQMQQQQSSPQQMNQRTPMSPQQMSSGAIHAMSAGNPEACPASPQLSSQTLGSVSSITNSPMDMQGVNKSNSVNNA